MKKNRIFVDTNFLLHLYNPQNFGNTWNHKTSEIFQKVLVDETYIFIIAPVVVREYIKVCNQNIMKTNNIKNFSKFKKHPNYIFEYNKPISFLKLLLELNRYEYLGTWEYKKIDDFFMKHNMDEVDSWLFSLDKNVMTSDRELNTKLGKNSIFAKHE